MPLSLSLSPSASVSYFVCLCLPLWLRLHSGPSFGFPGAFPWLGYVVFVGARLLNALCTFHTHFSSCLLSLSHSCSSYVCKCVFVGVCGCVCYGCRFRCRCECRPCTEYIFWKSEFVLLQALRSLPPSLFLSLHLHLARLSARSSLHTLYTLLCSLFLYTIFV